MAPELKITINYAALFSKYPYWRTSGEQERKVKQELYKILTKNKLTIKKAVEVGTKLVDVLKRAEQ